MANILKIWDEATQQYVGIPAIVGEKGQKGDSPVKGVDYWTEDDKAEIVQAVEDDFPTSLPASDVSSWAKAPNKPTYTATEVGARPNTWTPSASDVGLGNVGNFKAVSTAANQGLTSAEMSNARSNIGAGTSSFSGNYTDLSGKPSIPSKTSDLTNDSGFITTADIVPVIEDDYATKSQAQGYANSKDAAIAAAKQSGDNAQATANSALTKANAAVVANTAITGATHTKITYDSKGLVTGGSDLTATDIPTLSISKISGLQTELNSKQVSGDYATKAEAQGYANAKDAAIASAQSAANAAQSDVDSLETKIGTVASGKTVVGMIAEAQTAATYNDTGIKNRVKSIEDDYLKASDRTALSTAIATEKGRIDTFLASADIGDAAVDTLKEIQDYITTDGTAAAQMSANIAANTTAITAEESRASGAENSLNTRVVALEAVDHSHVNKALLDTYTQTNANIADAVTKKHSHSNISELNLIASGDKSKWDAAQAKAHEHSNKTVLDGITAAKVTSWNTAQTQAHEHDNLPIIDGITGVQISSWDAAEHNAKNYADSLSDNYAKKVHNHTKSQITDLVIPTKLSELTNDTNFITQQSVGTITPHIGENENWYIGNTDTGKPSRGESGVYVGSDEPEDVDVNVWIDIDGDEYAPFATKEYVDAAIANVSVSGTGTGTGTPGFSPTISTSKNGKTTTISITDVNGTKTATISDGLDGKSFIWRGEWESGNMYGSYDCVRHNGSVYVAPDGTIDGDEPDSQGSAWELLCDKGHSPVKGSDYWTNADKQGIVNDVLAALPVYAGGVR